MRKSVAAAVLAVVLPAASWLLAGCGASFGFPRHAASENQPQGGLPDPKFTLSLAHSWTATSTTAVDVVHRKLVEQFKQDHPDIRIAEDILDTALLKTKIRTLAAGNVLPDVFMMHGSDAEMLLDNGLIMPVDGLLDRDPAWRDGFHPEAFEDFRVGGVIAGIPIQLTASSLVFYNSEILRRAGYIEFPRTWDEFIDVVRRIRELGTTPIVMGNKDQWVAVTSLLSTLADRYTGTDWFVSLKERSGATFTDPEFVHALKAIKQLSDIGAFNANINNLNNNQQRTAYYVGQAAMFLEGGWAISSVVADAPKPILDRTRLAILPAVPGGRGKADAVSGGSGWALALNANLAGEKLEAAVRLVKWLTGEKAAGMVAELGDISVSRAANYDRKHAPELFAQYLDLLDKVDMTPVYDVRLPPLVVQTLNDGLQELLTPGSALTPEELAQRIQEVYEREQF
jgi:raffinose/stachyose/melibiose transport system substrate-binding protein